MLFFLELFQGGLFYPALDASAYVLFVFPNFKWAFRPEIEKLQSSRSIFRIAQKYSASIGGILRSVAVHFEVETSERVFFSFWGFVAGGGWGRGSMPRSFIEVLPRKRLLTPKPSGFSGEAGCAVSKTFLKTSVRRFFRGKRSMNASGSDPSPPPPLGEVNAAGVH